MTRCHHFLPFRDSAITQNGSQRIFCSDSLTSDRNQKIYSWQPGPSTVPSLYLIFLNTGHNDIAPSAENLHESTSSASTRQELL